MSVIHYRNCPTCGLAYEAHEETQNVTFVVAGRVVEDCPQCGSGLMLTEEEAGLRYATPKVFSPGKGGDDGA